MSVLTAGMIGTLSCGMRHSARGKKGGIGQPMTKVRQRASLPVDAVKLALEREHQKREDIKPIELLKVALSAYLAFTFNEDEANAKATAKTPLESTDSAALRRGTQAAVDRLLFNANYWRAATNRAFSKPASGQRTPGSACRPSRFGRRTPSS